MNTCEGCKYWERFDNKGWGDCLLGSSSGGEPRVPTKAYGIDSAHYQGYLKTREDFGCVQFVEKVYEAQGGTLLRSKLLEAGLCPKCGKVPPYHDFEDCPVM